MTRAACLATWSAIVAVVLGVPAAAQLAGPPVGAHGGLTGADAIGDVPAGSGVIRGRLTRRSGDDPLEDVALTLFALGADGRPGVRSGATGADGRFVFEGVAADPATVYLVGARYGGIPFGARVRFAPGATSVDAIIEVAGSSADGSALDLGVARLRIERGCSGVRVYESHALRNPTDRVLLIPPDARASQAPIFRIPLPEGAAFFEPVGGAFDGGAELRGGDVVFFGPVYPGDSSVDFAYSVASGGPVVPLQRSFPLGAEKVVVSVSGDEAPRGEGLGRARDVTDGDARYASAESGPLAPGQTLAFEVAAAERSVADERLSIREFKTWLEVDDAALDVREQFELVVAGDEPLRGGAEAPLLCVALPAGAEDLRFSQEAFGMGIAPDADGGLSLRGPLPPGSSQFGLTYRMRTRDGAIEFARSFQSSVTLLSMYIADTGLMASSGRLHRRRPVQTSDRVYIHLEGFEIEAGETVAVDLASLPAPRALPRLARVGFVACAAIFAVAVLSAPLRRVAAGAPAEPVSSPAVEERNAVYGAIRDLEDDFETGKISADDHAMMLRELRARAGALLARERRSTAEAATEPATPAPCASCGADVAAGSRFCSQCGAPVAAAAVAGTPAA